MPIVMAPVEPERRVHRVSGGENLSGERSVYPIQTMQDQKLQQEITPLSKATHGAYSVYLGQNSIQAVGSMHLRRTRYF
jgi:hypothetical protein